MAQEINPELFQLVYYENKKSRVKLLFHLKFKILAASFTAWG
jgi:hypothetical protein